jgi:uncharacterized protein
MCDATFFSRALALLALTVIPGLCSAAELPSLSQSLLTQTVGRERPVSAGGYAAGYWFQFYRSTFSKARGPVCNFNPSCSGFSQQAIAKYGFVTGLLMTTDRLARCNQCLNPTSYPRGTVNTIDGPRLYDPPEDHKATN